MNKKAFLIEQVIAIIHCKTPIKYKDPGCPIISSKLEELVWRRHYKIWEPVSNCYLTQSRSNWG